MISVLFDPKSGNRAVSIASSAPERVPDGLSLWVDEQADYSTLGALVWDEATAALVPRPVETTTQMSAGDFLRRLGGRDRYLHRMRIDPSLPLDVRGDIEWLHAWLQTVSASVVDVTDPVVIQAVPMIAQLLASVDHLPEGAEAFAAAMLAPVEVKRNE